MLEMGRFSPRLTVTLTVLVVSLGGCLFLYRYHRLSPDQTVATQSVAASEVDLKNDMNDVPVALKPTLASEVNVDVPTTTVTAKPSTSRRLKMELVIVPYLKYNASDSAILEREKEYMTVLKRNLDHAFVGRIHLLTTDTEKTTRRLEAFGLSNHNKLLIAKVNSKEKMQDAFEYISHNLVGVDVMFANADIYLGSGFENVDPIVMRKNKIMYSLTRHVKKEEDCAGERFKCIGAYYVGSHDTFLFHLTEPIPESALKLLDYNLSTRGMENVLMWMFQTRLKYCVLNPCTIMFTYHLHCTDLRSVNSQERVNNATTSGLAPFTKKLVCTYKP